MTVLARMKFWWNEIHFLGLGIEPQNQGDQKQSLGRDATNPSAQSSWRLSREDAIWLQVLLLLVAAVFMLANLNYPLIDRDETRYAEIPREMLATNNWVLPQLNFEPYYDKPPLLYWLCAISFKLFGVSEFAARLVPALAALVTLAATMWFGTRNFGGRVGLLSGVVLLLSVGFAFTSRYLLLDGVLAFLVSASLFSAYEAIKTDRLKMGWWLLSGVCVGFAFLTKGPLSLVLWLPPVFAMSYLTNSFAKPRWWHYGLIGFVSAVIVLPWFIAVSMHDANFMTEFFIKHNVRRFAGEFHAKPIWYFIPVLLVAGHPWSFLSIPYIRFLFGRSQRLASQRPLLLGYLMLWSGWCFVFFSLSSCKLPTYLLPASPAFALMIGHYLEQILSEEDDSKQHWFARFWSARSATAATCLAGVGFVGFILMTETQVSAIIYVWAIAWTILLVSSLLLISDRHQARIAWMTSSGVAFLFVVMVMHQLVPSYSRSQTIFGDSSPLNEQLNVHSQPAFATIRHEFSEVPFYLNRSDVSHFPNLEDSQLDAFVMSNSGCVLVVDNRITASELRNHIPAGCELTIVGERGPAMFYRAGLVPLSSQLIHRKEPF